MNKSVVTNLVALSIVVGGYLSPVYSHVILMTGLFALSGGVTNWLAVHMLFERVPFLYGSGVIPSRFEEFKQGIKQLIVQEFFTREHIERFLSNNTDNTASAISDNIDFDRIFNGLSEAIEESSLGGMLAMVGGRQALEPLKEPVIEKLKDIIAEISVGADANEGSDAEGEKKKPDLTSSLIDQVEQIIDTRLEELTPEKVKNIIQNMIRTHLGWLVVWGGVFGGLIGLVISVIERVS